MAGEPTAKAGTIRPATAAAATTGLRDFSWLFTAVLALFMYCIGCSLT